MTGRVTRRRGECAGALGCVFLLFALGLLAAGGLLARRGLAPPELGAPPAGPGHGATDLEIGSTLAPQLVRALELHPHALVVLSELDLSVLARTHNPSPERYRDPQVRVRDGHLVVSALTTVAGQTVTGVARLEVGLSGQATATPEITTHLDEVDVGQLPIPEWARATLNLPDDRVLDPSLVLRGNPTLRQLVGYVDCVGLTADGLRIGFHRPTAPADPAGCDVPPGAS